MFWADKILENVEGPQTINDSWTPSGMVHMGSLKGPVIHDILYKILKKRNQPVRFIYGFDDADPIDGLPKEFEESHSQYLGVPLFRSPSPDGKGSYGDYFSNKMKSLLQTLDIKPDEIYKTSELYKNGIFNEAIKFVLDHAAEVRKVYESLYKKKVSEDWYPLQAICPNCGKVGTTKVTGWDGKEVLFACLPDLVKWAKGCGFSGKISPFNGTSKLSFKVEWAAKWWTFGVTIEGAGKDHASAGGSYDVAMHLIQEVFKAKQPLKLAYEFFLSGGKKMSSSKGIGLSGEELLEVLGPQRVRFLMVKAPPNKAVEFTPHNTDSIPKVFDEYQRAFSGSVDDKRVFELSQVNEMVKPPPVRFSVLTQWVQMPNMEQKIKEESLQEWAKYARVWVEKYSPESERFTVQKELPLAVKELSAKQKEFLKKISFELDKDWDAEEFQKQLYEWVKELGLFSKDGFLAIYLSLIGKDHGPKAAWLILSLDKEFIRKRFGEIA